MKKRLLCIVLIVGMILHVNTLAVSVPSESKEQEEHVAISEGIGGNSSEDAGEVVERENDVEQQEVNAKDTDVEQREVNVKDADVKQQEENVEDVDIEQQEDQKNSKEQSPSVMETSSNGAFQWYVSEYGYFAEDDSIEDGAYPQVKELQTGEHYVFNFQISEKVDLSSISAIQLYIKAPGKTNYGLELDAEYDSDYRLDTYSRYNVYAIQENGTLSYYWRIKRSGSWTTFSTVSLQVKNKYNTIKCEGEDYVTVNLFGYTEEFSSKKRTIKTEKLVAKENAALTYRTNHKSVSVTKDGVVTIPGGFVGTIVITVTASATQSYCKTEKEGTIDVYPEQPDVASIVSGRATEMTIKWWETTTGDGFKIYYSTDPEFDIYFYEYGGEGNGKRVVIKNNKPTGLVIKGLKNNTRYYVWVTSYKLDPYSGSLDGMIINDNRYSVKVGLPKMNLSSVTTPKKKYLKAKWGKVSGCSGYQMQISLKSNFAGAKSKKISKSKTTYTVSGFKSKKKYYVRVRAYEKVGKKTYYGSWSKAKSVKVK